MHAIFKDTCVDNAMFCVFPTITRWVVLERRENDRIINRNPHGTYAKNVREWVMRIEMQYTLIIVRTND